MNNRQVDLHDQWLEHLSQEFNAEYMQTLSGFLRAEKAAKKVIYPQGSHIFAALNTTPLDSVKVVLLGQDPYHGPNQAHGLSFSVPQGVPPPPSLKNIYKELCDDLNLTIPTHGNLRYWAEQGVLLLNSVLTVEQSLAGSHQGRGWEQFTDKVIEVINQQRNSVVFLLWGAYAQKKGQVIDGTRHLVLKAPHPSPLSVHRGFFGCKHFSQTNAYLLQTAQAEIDWQIT